MKSNLYVIIDDDAASNNKLESLLQATENSVQIRSFNSLKSFVDSGLKPDALFLDVNLEDEFGYDLYSAMKVDFPVIVISGNLEYAALGFEYNIFDFISKPFSLSRVKVVLDKLKLMFKSGYSNEKLLISVKDTYEIISNSEIVKLEADGKYTIVKLDNDRQLISTNNLGYFETILNDHDFYRLHHGCIVNINKIEKILKGIQLKVVLSDGSTELVSKRQKPAFLKIFNKV